MKGTGFSPSITCSKQEGASAPEGKAQSSRPEGDAREAAGRFSREAWDGATALSPPTSTPTTPRASSPRPAPPPTSKSPRAATIPAAFCIIPQLRGKFRSRPGIGSIVAEAKSLIAQGVREITLIGQDTTCYGEDLLPQDVAHGKRPELADLLDALAPLPGLKWLRFLYAYPNKVTTRLLETIARHHNDCQVPRRPAAARLRSRFSSA